MVQEVKIQLMIITLTINTLDPAKPCVANQK